jgi:hypothetical protein
MRKCVTLLKKKTEKKKKKEKLENFYKYNKKFLKQEFLHLTIFGGMVSPKILYFFFCKKKTFNHKI